MRFERLGERISSVRGNISQAEFAKTLGVSRNTLIRYEKNETEPTAGFLVGLSVNYGTDVNWLLFGEGAPDLVNSESSLSNCAHYDDLEKELSDKKSEIRELTEENRQLVKEFREQAKEIREIGKENRELVKENRELMKENRNLGKENAKLVRQLARHDAEDLSSMPRSRNTRLHFAMPGAAGEHCLLPEDERNQDKYEERQE